MLRLFCTCYQNVTITNLTYDWELFFVGNCLFAIRLEQYILGFQVSMCQVQRVQKLYRLQGLPSYLPNLTDLEPFVAVVFDEVIQTFAEGLEHETHVV